MPRKYGKGEKSATLIYMIEVKSGLSGARDHRVYTVTGGNVTNSSFSVEDSGEGRNYTVYNNNGSHNDTYVSGVSRKELGEKLKKFIKTSMDKLKEDANFLCNYEDDAEYLAEKLIAATRKGNKKEVAELIRKSRRTDLL